MATQTALQVVNKVLNKLRLSEVTTFSEDYTKALLVMLNETKREIEETWDWTMLRDTITVTTSNGVQQYALTGMGERGHLLLDKWGRARVWDDTSDGVLLQISQDDMYTMTNSGTSQSGAPSYFSFEGMDSNGDPYVNFWPIPNGVFSIKFNVYAPQADLSATTDVPQVPYWPLLLGTYSKAVWERGEDRGYAFENAEYNYKTALADAVAFDAMKTPGALELSVG